MTLGNKLNSADAMGSKSWAVELRGISKRFPGVIANHDVELSVERASIHAIVGENGAGKSTLMKILYGLHQPDEGTITVNGVGHRFRSPGDAIASGIGMVHQHFMLADNLTVLENIILGFEPTRRGVLALGEARRSVSKIAASVGTNIDLDLKVSELGVGQRQRVEILKVLYRGANILILDEPTAVLVPQEVDELFINLRQLVTQGATVLFISHKLDEVLAVSDRITVMRHGTTVATVVPSEVDRLTLAELMVGSDLPAPTARVIAIGKNERLVVRDLTLIVEGKKSPVQNVSFAVYEGEIVGIAGVEGNGQFELCAAILGLEKSTGVVEVCGRDMTHSSTRERLDAGIAYIPFDRHREGLMLNSSLWENALLGREGRFSHALLINRSAAKQACREIIERFDVMTPSETVPAFVLSGGNQQKLVVGRSLSVGPSVLIAAHPTRGIDVGAQAAIWDEIRIARDNGMAVLLVSADLEEILALSDRILIIFDGRISAELAPEDADPQILGTFMTGGRVSLLTMVKPAVGVSAAQDL